MLLSQDIEQGLRQNIFSGKSYEQLGDLYFNNNSYKQAYICYEQASALDDPPASISIQQKLKASRQACSEIIPKVAIVILTYNNLKYSKKCIDSIRKYNSKTSCEIIVVDNGSTDGTVSWIKKQKDIKYQLNKENKGFPSGCNQGILMAGSMNDILFLNNDTVVMPNSILNLRLGLYANKETGAIGSVSNNISYFQQIDDTFDTFQEYITYAKQHNIFDDSRNELRLKLIGFAMLVKRSALDKIGVMDERFTPGNYEDDDLSIRLLSAGYQLRLCKSSFIYHFGSVSFNKQKKNYLKLLDLNRLKFYDKWQIYASELFIFSPDICSLVSISHDKTDHILVIDYGCGAQEMKLYHDFPEIKIVGVWMNQIQKTYKAKVVANTPIELVDYEFLNDIINKFEYILLTDTLCRIKNVDSFLENLKRHLSSSGRLLIRIPNKDHFKQTLSEVNRYIKRIDFSAIDQGYIQAYNVQSITEKLKEHGYQIEFISHNTIPESPEETAFLNKQHDNDQERPFQYFITAAIT